MGRTRNVNRSKRARTNQLLFSGCSDEHTRERGTPKTYDPDFHPEDIVQYFERQYAKVDDAKRYCTDKGVVGYTVKPVRLPTQARYSTMIGVTQGTLWEWAKQYPEFGHAMEVAKAYQAAFLIEQGTTGGLNATVTNFVLKNLQGWTERNEETIKGTVSLQFDAQDDEA